MRILIIAREYAPFPGGYQQQMARIAAGLVDCGHSVTVLTGRFCQDLPRFRVENGVRVHRLWEPRIPKLRSAAFIVHLVLHMLRHKCDAILTVCVNETSFMAIRMGHLLGCPVALRLTNYGPEYGNFADAARKPVVGRIYTKAARQCDALVAQTKAFFPEAASQGIGQNRVYHIPNAVDPHFIDLRQQRTQYGQKPLHILWCGRLEPQKDPLCLVPLAQTLTANDVPSIIDVLGEGSLSDAMKQAIEQLGKQTAIRLHGAVRDTRPYYKQAGLFLLTSTHDPMPNVILEAMAAGLPIVATDVGGVPEMIDDGETGLLVPPGDASAAAEAIMRLARDPELATRLGHNAQKKVRDTFSPERIATQYEAMFEDMLAGRAG